MLIYESLSCFKERPSETIRYLIRRNLDELVKYCMQEATQFQHTNLTKSKALDQLKFTLLIGQQAGTKHTQVILKTLVKIAHNADDIPGAHQKINQIVQIIGYFSRPDYYIPLLISILGQEQFKNNYKNTVILLNILGHMLSRSQEIQPHIDLLTKTLLNYQTQFYDNDEGLLALFGIINTLLQRLPEITNSFLKVTFEILVNVQATRTIAEVKRRQAASTLELLAKRGGFASVAELHATQIGPILQKMIKNKQYTSWNKTSKNRFKFDAIIRNCSSQVGRFLQQILQVFQWMVNPQNDLEVRMDTLVLIQHVLNQTQLKQFLSPLSEQIVKQVLLKSIQWKVGKPQIKIRKAGVINIILMIEKEIINGQQLLFCFKDLVPHLKNCLSDDWAPQLRLASCQLLQKYLLATKENIGDDELRQLYPILLQRLDDSQDPIRIKMTSAINVFFSCRYIKLSESTLDYMINAIFVHFDDSSEDVQSAIYTSLKHAAVVDPKLVLKHAQINVKRMKHVQKCEELIEYCKQKVEEYE